MKVLNQTRYRTAVLRTIICRAHASLRRHQGRLHSWDHVEIRVLRRLKGGHTSGHAYLSGRSAVLTLPCPRCYVHDVYRLVWHEMQHLYGYSHKQMGAYYPSEDETALACEGLPAVLEEAAPRKKPVVDRKAQELARVGAAIKRWESKLKRAENALKKLRKRKRYYDRVVQQRSCNE